MPNPNSRYSDVGVAQVLLRDGRAALYLKRRLLPPCDSLPLLGQVPAARDERLDLFAYRTLGDPEHFWQIADANDALRPEDLTAGVERALRVPLPQFPGAKAGG